MFAPSVRFGSVPLSHPGMIAGVHAAALVVGEHRHVAQAADDDDVLAQRLERLEDRRQLEARAAAASGWKFGRNMPFGTYTKPSRASVRRGRRRGKRRHHRIEERQRHARRRHAGTSADAATSS